MSIERIKIKKVDDILADALDLSDTDSESSDGVPPAAPAADVVSKIRNQHLKNKEEQPPIEIPTFTQPEKKKKRGPPIANLEKAWAAKTAKKQQQEEVNKKILELQAQLETAKAKKQYKTQLKETKLEAKKRALVESVNKNRVDDELEIDALKNEILAEMTKSKYLKHLASVKPLNSKLETKVVQNPNLYEPPKMNRSQIVASFGF
jgi:hypothetical protein